jgi:hypothetical protein
MPTAYRYDQGELSIIERGNGFLRARVTLARAGVFPYLHQDGQIRLEAKLPDEIFSEATIESAKGVPGTDGHPPQSDSRGLVTPANYRNYTRSAMGDSITIEEIDGEFYLAGTETVFDAGLIADLEAGRKREVSIGFELDVDPTPGELNGKRYDVIQRNIRINHFAHVDQGRAGPGARVHLDGADGDIAVMTERFLKQTRRDEMADQNQPAPTSREDESMWKGLVRLFSILGSRGDSAPPVPPATPGSAPTPPEPADDGVKKLEAEIEALKAVVAEKTKQLEELTSPAKMDAAIQGRVALIEMAKAVIPDIKHDGMPERDLKLKIVEKILPNALASRKDALTDVQLDAYYEAASNLARERAAERSTAQDGAVKLDEKAIAEKKSARLNMNKGKK